MFFNPRLNSFKNGTTVRRRNPMTRNTEIARAVRYSIVTGAVTIAAAASLQAQAQDQAQATDQDTTTLVTVIVTGSRIPQPALEAATPVTSVTNAEIQQTGITRIEDLMNTLPQVMGQYGAGVSNGATGEATVSLRGLGANRTMVLVNGRRLMPGDPTQNGNEAPDLNQIPTALVERVDVLTGGASATYGADAVAGVVNFVMNDHFEGVRITGNLSAYQHNNHDTFMQGLVTSAGFVNPPSNVTDGRSVDFSVITGSNFADGKGNATAYFGYRQDNPVLQGRRDYSACSLTTTGGAATCGGSLTSNPAVFNLGGQFMTVGPGKTIVPASFSGAGTSLYNYAPLNYYQRPDQRYTAGAFVRYEINDHAKVYSEFMFMDDRTTAQIAPSGAFYGSGTGAKGGIRDATWVVNCSNPYLSANEYAAFGCTSPADSAHLIFGRRNVEGGPRTDDLRHTSFRMVLGIKGDISDSWTYDAYALNGITRLSENYLNDVSRSRISNALLAVNQVNPATGATSVVCAANSGGALGAPGCVPWNIFQVGGVTPAAAAYLNVPGLQEGATTERVVDANVTGDLGKMGVKLPTAHDGLAVSFGTEYRSEQTELQPDLEYITNDLAGQGSPTLPTSGAFHVWDLFGEARLPILQDMPFAKSLTAEAGYRYSDYNLVFGSTNTYKFGLQWAPTSDFHFRGEYQRAVRAPNIQELYLQPRVQLDSTIGSDPCANKVGGTPKATAAQCAASGVTAAEYGNIPANTSAQYNGLVGGNANLAPEKADTVTFGVVLTPTFAPNLNVTLDYYDIKIKGVITQYGAGLILQTCLTTADPFFCSKVHRVQGTGTSADGSLWIGDTGYVADGTFNLGSQTAKGIDADVNYKLDIGAAGRLTFNFVGSYDLKFETQPLPGGGTYDCAGLYGPTCGVAAPKWKHKLRATWNTPVPALDFSIAWRYVGPVSLDAAQSNPLLAGNALDPGLELARRSYIDLTAAYQVASHYTVRLGVNNVFDKNPPLAVSPDLPGVFGNGNTLPQIYDALGRYLFMNVTLDF
jgi:iron complex outermembrane recepter protein